MLVEHTLWGVVDKVATALDRIKTFEPPEGYYVAFSGGKDSIVILDLVRKSGVKHDAHMNMTSVDPPEVVRFVKKHYPDVIRHKPVMSMWKLIEKKMMPPTRLARYCCEVLKEGGGKGRFVITGVRWEESYGRSTRKLVEACTKNKTTMYIRPIIDWSTKDIWEYIHKNNLPYCSLYDEGFKRIGCIGCPMSHNKLKEFHRWPHVEKMYRDAFQKAMKKRIASGRLAERNWTSGEAMFDWWMEENRKKDEAQCVLFE